MDRGEIETTAEAVDAIEHAAKVNIGSVDLYDSRSKIAACQRVKILTVQ